MSQASAHKTGANPAPRPSGWLFAVAAVTLTVAAFVGLLHFGQQGDPELNQRVSRAAPVVWIGSGVPRLSLPEHGWVAEDQHSDLARALSEDDPQPVATLLSKHALKGVLVAFDGQAKQVSVRDRMRRFGYVRGLRADYLTPGFALYVPDPLQGLASTLQEALATVARGVLGGQRAPKVTSFPEALRRVQNVEVMVLIRRDGRALLWRSARGSSIARALLLATQMARRRWAEREQALGGSLDRLLPKLQVEVALLHEDGTLGDRDPAFIDRVFGSEHGVAYERRGGWHYTLPEATQRDGHGAASKAYAKLFEDNGLPASSLERQDVRLYRLAMTTLATSEPTDTGEDDPARVTTPEDVLGVVKP